MATTHGIVVLINHLSRKTEYNNTYQIIYVNMS